MRVSMEEHKEREAANIAWLKKAFASAKAEGSPGLVMITHANPEFENRWTRTPTPRATRAACAAPTRRRSPEPAPYDGFLDALIAEMQGYAKPVLYVHGDTHIFRIGKPLMNPKTQRFLREPDAAGDLRLAGLGLGAGGGEPGQPAPVRDRRRDRVARHGR
jgi:hypothetical protein